MGELVRNSPGGEPGCFPGLNPAPLNLEGRDGGGERLNGAKARTTRRLRTSRRETRPRRSRWKDSPWWSACERSSPGNPSCSFRSTRWADGPRKPMSVPRLMAVRGAPWLFRRQSRRRTPRMKPFVILESVWGPARRDPRDDGSSDEDPDACDEQNDERRGQHALAESGRPGRDSLPPRPGSHRPARNGHLRVFAQTTTARSGHSKAHRQLLLPPAEAERRSDREQFRTTRRVNVFQQTGVRISSRPWLPSAARV